MVSIIGSGNVATQLGKAFVQNGISVSHVASRNPAHGASLASQLGAAACNIADLPKDQLAVVCVSDDAIAQVLDALPASIPAAYTSGSVGIDQLPERPQLGVFYPLQTMSKTSELNIIEVPILVESNDPIFLETLFDFAEFLSPQTRMVNSEQRRKIHLAAVWINNFTNHVVHQAQEIAREQQVDYTLLQPLLRETFRKLEHQSAFDAQTGPARRGDTRIIETHVNSMEGTRKELYALLSRSIQETYGND